MQEKIAPGTPGTQLKAASILFNALLVGVILFLAIAFAVTKLNGRFARFDESFDKIFLSVVAVVAGVCLVSAISGYRKRMNTLDLAATSFDEKFNTYRDALILYLALCEGPALFSVIGFLLTKNYWFIAITLIMLISMLFKRPTKQKVINELQLSSQDLQEL